MCCRRLGVLQEDATGSNHMKPYHHRFQNGSGSSVGIMPSGRAGDDGMVEPENSDGGCGSIERAPDQVA